MSSQHKRQPRISVIIPAANEESLILRAIRSVKANAYSECEIIVVSNGSTDRTEELARNEGAEVLTFRKLKGYSGARNEGAKVATGKVLIFMDADSFMDGTLLWAVASSYLPGILGTPLGGPDKKKAAYLAFFFLKNLAHRLALYRGVLGGLFFIDKDLFSRIGGYDAMLQVDENYELIHRARKAGGKYKLLTGVKAYTSMRRFEKEGLLSALLFWIRVRLAVVLLKKKRVGYGYASSHDKFGSP